MGCGQSRCKCPSMPQFRHVCGVPFFFSIITCSNPGGGCFILHRYLESPYFILHTSLYLFGFIHIIFYGDISSNITMGIAPQNWGPHVWAAIHLICLGAPETFTGSDSSGYRAFFTNLPSILPCEKCQEHLRQNLSELSMEAALSGGRESLFRWSVQLHNKVNAQLGKRMVPYEEAKEFWTNVSNGTQLCFPSSSTTSNANATKTKGSDVILYLIIFMLGVFATLVITSMGRRKS